MIRLIEQRETLLCIFCNEYHFVTSISVKYGKRYRKKTCVFCTLLLSLVKN